MLGEVIKWIIYVLLVVLLSYNIYLSVEMTKFKRRSLVRSVEELSQMETQMIAELSKTKRKWSLLEQTLFLIAIFMAFKGKQIEVAFFIDLYTVASIATNKLTYQIFRILALKD